VEGASVEPSRRAFAQLRLEHPVVPAAGDRFVLTVEGMAWDDGGKANVRALLSNPTSRATLVADIMSEITSRGIDGVSFDFEPILSDQRDNFAALLNDMRVALDAVNPMYQLTFAATGSQSALTYQMFGAVTAVGAADAVIIMGYPLRGMDAKYAGGLAPYDSPLVYDLKQITNSYLKYVSPTSIVLALPWYGRQWPTVSGELNACRPVRSDSVRPPIQHRLRERPSGRGASTAGSSILSRNRRGRRTRRMPGRASTPRQMLIPSRGGKSRPNRLNGHSAGPRCWNGRFRMPSGLSAAS